MQTTKRATNYDDKTKEIMHYIRERADGSGKRVRINNPQGLQTYLKGLNSEESARGRKPRFTADFIRKVTGSNYARQHLPITLGSFGHDQPVTDYGVARDQEETQLEQEQRVRLEQLRKEGRSGYTYESGSTTGLAVRATWTQHGKKEYGFRDAKTGRFVSKKNIRNEL